MNPPFNNMKDDPSRRQQQQQRRSITAGEEDEGWDETTTSLETFLTANRLRIRRLCEQNEASSQSLHYSSGSASLPPQNDETALRSTELVLKGLLDSGMLDTKNTTSSSPATKSSESTNDKDGSARGRGGAAA